jgi:kumamolisin
MSESVPSAARRVIPGSERPPVATAEQRAVPADVRVEATVVLRRRAELPDRTEVLTPEELAARHGADPADVELVSGALTALGVEITAVDAASRRLRIAGPADVLAAAFGTSLAQVSAPNPAGTPVTHRYRTGALSVPAELEGVVTAVLGLDDRPQARARFQVAAVTPAAGFTPVELGRVYSFPDGDGSGQTIAIIELGGGFAQSELDTYFRGLGISGPTVTAVGVDGGANVAGQDPQGADGEVLLDIEVAGALARVPTSSSTSHPTPTPVSSTPSRRPPTPHPRPRRSASAGAGRRTPGPGRPAPPSTTPWPTRPRSA